MAVAKSPPVRLADFEQISRAILGMLVAENADITASCLFFGLIGEAILRKHYKINAMAVMGAASFNLGGINIAFANAPGSQVATEEANFHCWIEANGWFIDFSSIVFPEVIKSAGHPACGRLMFQKPLTKAALSLAELDAKGGFYCLSDSAMTKACRAGFHAIPAYDDLLNIITEQYVKPPKAMPTFGLMDKYGHTKPVSIASKRLDGVW